MPHINLPSVLDGDAPHLTGANLKAAIGPDISLAPGTEVWVQVGGAEYLCVTRGYPRTIPGSRLAAYQIRHLGESIDG